MGKDVFTNAPEILVDVGVCVPQDGQAQFLQVSIPDAIGLFSWNIIVLGAVQLDDQLPVGNVEIHDIGAMTFWRWTMTGSCLRKSYHRCRS